MGHHKSEEYVMKRSDPNRPTLIPPPGVKINQLGCLTYVPNGVPKHKGFSVYFLRKEGQGYNKIPHEFLIVSNSKKGIFFVCDSPIGLCDLYVEYKNCPKHDKIEKERLRILIIDDLDIIAKGFHN